MIEEEVFYPSIKDQEHGRPQGQKPRLSFLPTQPRKHSEAARGPVSARQAGPDLAVALTRQEGANGFRASPRERADSARQPLLRAGAPRSPAEPLLTGVSRPGAAPSTRKRTGTLGRRHGRLARSCRLCGVLGLRIASPPPAPRTDTCLSSSRSARDGAVSTTGEGAQIGFLQELGAHVDE